MQNAGDTSRRHARLAQANKPSAYSLSQDWGTSETPPHTVSEQSMSRQKVHSTAFANGDCTADSVPDFVFNFKFQPAVISFSPRIPRPEGVV
eukprot:6082244-Amphidinium_carterae.1